MDLGKYEDASQFTSSISTKKETSFDSFHFQPLLQGVAWYFERYTRTCTRTRFERSTNCPEPEFRSHFSQLYFRNLGSVLAKFGGRLSKFRSERNLLTLFGGRISNETLAQGIQREVITRTRVHDSRLIRHLAAAISHLTRVQRIERSSSERRSDHTVLRRASVQPPGASFPH